uniref:thiol oxidase n=1 Tax=viral metagenome TaxID=1070528 RepID=A0A6C0FIR7_9ZZZZ|tara:strand:+ start:5680 stop:6111 length:432 start_codon:yes stop_codon:yes gene_type:complete
MKLDSKIWGPHYWFFLHTAAMSYPVTPNDTVKKKFYEFIQNFPLFIPDPKISASFTTILDTYPVSPYLDSKDSLVRWTHFIHNKINKKLEKDVISLEKFYTSYYKQYETTSEKQINYIKTKKHVTYAVVVLCLLLLIYIFHKK